MNKLIGLDQGRISKLGDIAYYWAAEDVQLQDDVIISAHGGIKRSAGEDLTVKPNLTLKYYVDHGLTQGDFGLGKFAAPTPPVAVQTVLAGGKTYNYELSKYQGRHNEKGKETYATIQTQSDNAKRHNTTLDVEFPNGVYPPNVARRQQLFDVVSIRNRWWTSGSDLKTILDLILKHRGKGATIHCFFCRSFMGVGGDTV